VIGGADAEEPFGPALHDRAGSGIVHQFAHAAEGAQQHMLAPAIGEAETEPGLFEPAMRRELCEQNLCDEIYYLGLARVRRGRVPLQARSRGHKEPENDDSGIVWTPGHTPIGGLVCYDVDNRCTIIGHRRVVDARKP
jgi:hypothetical protein